MTLGDHHLVNTAWYGLLVSPMTLNDPHKSPQNEETPVKLLVERINSVNQC